MTKKSLGPDDRGPAGVGRGGGRGVHGGLDFLRHGFHGENYHVGGSKVR